VRFLFARLIVRAVQDIINRYPIVIDGQMLRVNPHDLRRTYARRLYDAGTLMLAIQQDLGHADHKTTEECIGTLDAGARKPPKLFKPPHLRQLNGLAGV
jgi:integrase